MENVFGKVSPRLTERLALSPDSVEVIVELCPSAQAGAGTRLERIAALTSAFDAQAAPVKQAVVEAGGEVLGAAWINQTLRIPAALLGRVAAEPAVVSIDLPRPLKTTA